MSTQDIDPRRVNANPDKRFFLYMLVKDIELVPAIIDLVDNSIDGARSVRGPDGDFDGLEVRIEADAERFMISDNCGGMDAETARNYAFRFGRPEQFEGVEMSVGQFGIGMKRAIFKVGKHAVIRSGAETSTFALTVDVDAWAADTSTDWTFSFDEVEDEHGSPEEERGVSIEITRLHPGVSDDLGRVDVIGKLRSNIMLRHEEALSRGIRIEVNGDVLPVRNLALLESELINPIHRVREINQNGGAVELRIVAGIAPPISREEGKDEGEGSEFTEPGEAGWYMYCNGRLVLSADRSELTGWGRAAPAYHPQYRRFRGYAFLSARDSALLPWNTTKTSVDQDSPVFRVVQQEMFSALEVVVSVLNLAKRERQSRGDENGALTMALAQAHSRPVQRVSLSDTYKHPPATIQPRQPPNTVRIQYEVDRRDFEDVQDALGVTTRVDVGRETFNYYLENEVGR